MSRTIAMIGLCLCSAPLRAAVIDAAGQSFAHFEIVDGVPSVGEIITIDLVLDATNYSGDFEAWQFFEGWVEVAADTPGLSPANIVAFADQPGATAPSDVDGDGTEEFGPFGGDAWTSGRRPGATPFAGSSFGGAQFGDGISTIMSTANGLRLATDGGGEFGAFQTFGGAPFFNTNLHRGRVYHAYRFQLLVPDISGELTISAPFTDASPDPIAFSVYTGNEAGAGDISDFLINATITPLTIAIPAPATLAIFGALPMLIRRRR